MTFLLPTLSGWWTPESGYLAAQFVLFAVASAVSSLAVITVVLIRLPADYFSAPTKPPTRWSLGVVASLAGRNLIGWFLILVGCVMAVPGVPGQGLLMIAVGMTFADFPRKFQLQKRLMQRPALRAAADKVRARFGREPLRF